MKPGERQGEREKKNNGKQQEQGRQRESSTTPAFQACEVHCFLGLREQNPTAQPGRVKSKHSSATLLLSMSRIFTSDEYNWQSCTNLRLTSTKVKNNCPATTAQNTKETGQNVGFRNIHQASTTRKTRGPILYHTIENQQLSSNRCHASSKLSFCTVPRPQGLLLAEILVTRVRGLAVRVFQGL